MYVGYNEDIENLKNKTELELIQKQLCVYIKEVQSHKTEKRLLLLCVNNGLGIKALKEDFIEHLQLVAKTCEREADKDDEEER